MWAFSNFSIVELPLNVATRLIPHRSNRSSSTKASPPMLYSPSRLMLNLPFGGVSSRPITCLNRPLLAI